MSAHTQTTTIETYAMARAKRRGNCVSATADHLIEITEFTMYGEAPQHRKAFRADVDASFHLTSLPPGAAGSRVSCANQSDQRGALFHQRFPDGFGRFLNLGLAFKRVDDRMGIRVTLVRDGAGDAGHVGGNDVDWPSAWQGKFL